jgi:glycine/D-amino acid oxidase-like deaminating enzyme
VTEPVPADTAWALYTLADQAADWRRRAEQAIARAERAEAELGRTREVVARGCQMSCCSGPTGDETRLTDLSITGLDALRTDKEGADGP